MKKILTLLTIAFALVALSSCHKDDDNSVQEWREKNEKAYVDSIQNGGYLPIEGIAGMPLGVYYKVLPGSEDKGAVHPLQTSKVRVLYQGRFYNGTVFDGGSSLTGDNPIQFSISNTIRGFQIALQQMVVGNHWRICIPWALGYRDTANGSIPAYSTLIFDVTLVEIIE
ncbi:MAG: FKBP-type peptidyl-prolyl cis-trans isomerase [Dysgonamonadaceae bacterium]|jgi:FKBP-type peptidyl-prolyl cis-trans isomerase|nr:FKBP-type peptidyl-prolyl cis-trans isomerase [Dysgonamonadaceae bacterium]